MHFCSSIPLMSIFFNFNGNLFKAGTPVLEPGYRGVRYGDGLFETLRVSHGRIRRRELHFARLFNGLRVLKFTLPGGFTEEMLQHNILELCAKNNHNREVRVRLMILRGNGGLDNSENNFPAYIIESIETEERKLNIDGLAIDVYPDVFKCYDSLSNLKTNNYLPYIMGAFFAKEQHLDDVLILNNYYRICESTRANIFSIAGSTVFTPALTEGCVAGVTRQWLLRKLPALGYEVIEKKMSMDDLYGADGIFLTNAIQEVGWVKKCGRITYTDHYVRRLYNDLTTIPE